MTFVIFEIYLNKVVFKKIAGEESLISSTLLIHSLKTVTPLTCFFKPFGCITFVTAVYTCRDLYNSCLPNSGYLDLIHFVHRRGQLRGSDE